MIRSGSSWLVFGLLQLILSVFLVKTRVSVVPATVTTAAAAAVASVVKRPYSKKTKPQALNPNP